MGTDEPALQFEGHLAGVYNMTLEAGKVVNVGTGATNNFESATPFDAVTGMLLFCNYLRFHYRGVLVDWKDWKRISSESFMVFPLMTCPQAYLHVVGMLRFMFDGNQSSLLTLFYSVLASVSVFIVHSVVFHSISSPDSCLFSDSVLPVLSLSSLVSALLVLSTIYISNIKVSFSPDIIPRG